jgi:tRNA/rRNA methyltransferase
LNLAQAVAIICYACASKSQTVAKPVQAEVASKAMVQHLFDHLEQELDARNFWRVSHKKEAMWRNIRSLFQRAQMSEQEVRTLRGMVRCLTDGHTDDAGI